MWWVTDCRNICCRQLFFASIYRASILNMLTADTMNLLTLFLLRHFNHEQSPQHLTSKAPLDMPAVIPNHLSRFAILESPTLQRED
ncbi:unnamed protein product [Sphagnum balticum]